MKEDEPRTSAVNQRMIDFSFVMPYGVAVPNLAISCLTVDTLIIILTERESDNHPGGLGPAGRAEPALVLELVIEREPLAGGEDGVLLDELEAELVLAKVVGITLGLRGSKLFHGVPTTLAELSTELYTYS